MQNDNVGQIHGVEVVSWMKNLQFQNAVKFTPQQAIEAPRFRSQTGLRVSFEDRVPGSVLDDLASRGHEPEVIHGWTATFGGAQMILIESWGTLTVGSDPRREAYGMAY